MEQGSSYLRRLVEELSALPGVGEKTAARLAYHIISEPPERAQALAGAIAQAREHVHRCNVCCNLTDSDICPICASPRRDRSTVMVVENPRDLSAYEKTGRYEGVYHVLHGAISPMLGIGPDDICLPELMRRVEAGGIEEVILATNSSLEGETTAMYIAKLLKPLGVRTTRIASGVPVGGDLEYIDEVTLLRALEGRTEI